MKKSTLAVSVVAAAVLSTGAYAFASSSDAARPTLRLSDTAATTTAAGGNGQGGLNARLGRVAGRVVHGDLIVRTPNGFSPVTLDRGRVTAVSASAITLMRPDHVVVTMTITAATKFRGVSSADQIATGKAAVVMSREGTATLVVQRTGRAENPRNNGNFPQPSGVAPSEEQVPAA